MFHYEDNSDGNASFMCMCVCMCVSTCLFFGLCDCSGGKMMDVYDRYLRGDGWLAFRIDAAGRVSGLGKNDMTGLYWFSTGGKFE